MVQVDDTVRRTDLELRIQYIGLHTEIYQMDKHKYVIYCKNVKGDFKALCEEFDQKIRPAGFHIELVQKKPCDYLQCLESISMHNPVDGFRASVVTGNELDYIIRSKFFAYGIEKVSFPKRGVDFEIEVEVSTGITPSEKESLRSQLIALSLGTDKITVVRRPKSDETADTVAGYGTSSANLVFHPDFGFDIAEAGYWYDVAEDIYKGKITRADIPFFRDGISKCYLDFSKYPNIDIRNLLLLYDTVYLGMPTLGGHTDFFERQNMTPGELVELTEMGKLVLCLPHQTDRYDKTLLQEIYQNMPSGILSKHGLNTLLSSFLNETKETYLANNPKAYEIAAQCYADGKASNDILLQKYAQTLAWPVISVAQSFRYLNNYGTMSIMSFGANRLIGDLLVPMDSFVADDMNALACALGITATMNSLHTHIASALNATYFPYPVKMGGFSDSTVSNMMSDVLKSFWYGTDGLEKIKSVERTNIAEKNGLDLFECKKSLSVLKVANAADKYNTPDGFRQIITDLANMEPDQRRNRIAEYNNTLVDIEEIGESRKQKSFRYLFNATSFFPLSDPVSIMLTICGLGKEAFDNSEFGERVKRIADIQRHLDESKGDTTVAAEDVYLLDRLSRVATLV